MHRPSFGPLEDASAFVDDREKLAAKMSKNGYLFFRNLIEARNVEELKMDIIRILKEFGYVDKRATSEPTWSKKEPQGNEIQIGGEVQKRIARLKSIKALYTSKEMMGVYRKFLGGEVFPWLENPERVRIILPGGKSVNIGGQMLSMTTPGHQDHVFFRRLDGIEVPFCTTWAPIMDIDESVGGLAIMKNSHRRGFYKHLYRNGQQLGVPSSKDELHDWLSSGAVVCAGEVDPSDVDGEWLRADYRPGDVLIFSQYILHRGLPNTSEKIRLSADFRYQRKETPLMWRVKRLLSYTVRYRAELRRNLDNLGIKGGIADKIWYRLDIEGPSRRKTIQARIRWLLRTIQ